MLGPESIADAKHFHNERESLQDVILDKIELRPIEESVESIKVHCDAGKTSL